MQQAERRQDVLDLFALVEADAADDLVGDAAKPQRLFDGPALRGGAVHHGDVVVGDTVDLRHAPDLVGDELRFVTLIRQLAQDDLLAVVVLRAQAAVDAGHVFADDAVGGLDDASRRAVIQLQVDLASIGVILLEIEDVADVGLAPAVDRLVGIADDEQVAVPFRERGDKHVLHPVGVLVLVDHDVQEALLIAFQQVGRCLEEVDRLGEQVIEIERAGPAQEPLVLLVDASDDFFIVGRGQIPHFVRGHQLALGGGDASANAAGLVELGIETNALQRGLDGFDLVAVVIDGELGHDPEPVGHDPGVLTQQTSTEGMEGAHGDAVERPSLAEMLDAGAHLPGRLVGEGHGQDAVAGDLLDLHQVGDAVGEHPRLARPGSGDDEHGSVGREHGFALRLIQPGEKFGCDGGRDRIQGRRSAPGSLETRNGGVRSLASRLAGSCRLAAPRPARLTL